MKQYKADRAFVTGVNYYTGDEASERRDVVLNRKYERSEKPRGVIPVSLGVAAVLLINSTESFLMSPMEPSVGGVRDQEVHESQPSAERLVIRQQVQRFPFHRPTWYFWLRQEFPEQTAITKKKK
jgi:hypothetical protein